MESRPLAWKLPRGYQSSFENLHSHSTIDCVETLDNSGLDSPTHRKLFLKRQVFCRVLDQVAFPNPLPVDGMEIGGGKDRPVRRQVFDRCPPMGA